MTTAVIRVVLVLAGVGIVILGVNSGLGGIRTLGWQVAPDFVMVTDASAFHVQDSHARFLGGLFAAIGMVFIAGAFWPGRLKSVLISLCAIIAMAGLFRLSSAGQALFSDDGLLRSLLFELVFFPVLALALWRYGPELENKEILRA